MNRTNEQPGSLPALLSVRAPFSPFNSVLPLLSFLQFLPFDHCEPASEVSLHNSRVIKNNFLVGLMVSSVLEPVHGMHKKLHFLKELRSFPWFQKRLKIGHNTKRFSGKIRGRGRSSLQIFGENEFVRKRLPLPHSLPPPVLPSPFPSKPSTFGRASERAQVQ